MRLVPRAQPAGRPSRASALRRGAAALGLVVLGLGGCLDVGYPARPPPPEPDAGADGSDGSGRPDGCVEGPVAPSTDGTQLVFSALDVDRHEVTVQSGGTITWTNASTATHTATAGAPGATIPKEEGGFDSGAIPAGDQWAWRFCDPRELEWYCRTHPAQMFGYRIRVE